MANNPKQGIIPQTVSNMDCSSDSDDSSSEVPMPIAEPKPSTSNVGTKAKNTPKGRGKKKKAPEDQGSGDYELVWDITESTPNDVMENKCKIGKNFLNSYYSMKFNFENKNIY